MPRPKPEIPKLKAQLRIDEPVWNRCTEMSEHIRISWSSIAQQAFEVYLDYLDKLLSIATEEELEEGVVLQTLPSLIVTTSHFHDYAVSIRPEVYVKDSVIRDSQGELVETEQTEEVVLITELTEIHYEPEEEVA